MEEDKFFVATVPVVEGNIIEHLRVGEKQDVECALISKISYKMGSEDFQNNNSKIVSKESEIGEYGYVVFLSYVIFLS